MTTNTRRESATIYQFPARGRFASAATHEEWRASNNPATQRAQVVSGGAWYHEEALREADESRKN